MSQSIGKILDEYIDGLPKPQAVRKLQFNRNRFVKKAKLALLEKIEHEFGKRYKKAAKSYGAEQKVPFTLFHQIIQEIRESL